MSSVPIGYPLRNTNLNPMFHFSRICHLKCFFLGDCHITRRVFSCFHPSWNTSLLSSSPPSLLRPWNFRRMASGNGNTSPIVPQDFDYFLVLDFEATCLENQKIEPQEVIEFPVLKVSGKTFQTEATFHQYVEPQVHGVGEFCTRLTGITRDMVKNQPTFADTLKLFHIWMEKEGLIDPDIKFIFVTCGDWDLKTMLPSQCAHFELPYHSYFRRWLNIKKAYATVTSHYPKGMMQMLEKLNIPHVGRHHSGIDDCRNIANILQALAHRRYKFKQTGSR
ncbi:ERI1 exoribonuclease 3-like isoform X2 [Lytechinus variegatus]|uniref:ERI1 exoribonuclease 3-like isoform X2 n=1 Tax=Lytechinus variegatus TaxID=7654 RepID=UPI001BB22DC0|nr:ERI1 exoribonuclease 3-like isoform X2 [Lytechinus variegatus]